MGEVKDFLKALCENPEAKKLFREAKEPAGIEEAAALYADIAAKTGISVSKETIQDFLGKREKVQQGLTAKAESAVKEALDDSALETVAGGIQGEKLANCASTAVPGEWCFFSDACSVIINYYDDPNIKYDEAGYQKATQDGGGFDPFDGFDVWTNDKEALPECSKEFEVILD